MLEALRKHKDSFGVKVGLISIAVLFVIFFGSETLRHYNGRSEGSPASVNGVEINPVLFDNLYKRQAAQFGGKVPEQLVDLLKSSVVNKMISEELINQEIKKLGLKASPEAISDLFKSDPEFSSRFFDKDGKFNKEAYESELNAHMQQFGTPFLPAVAKELSTAKAGDLLRSAVHSTADEQAQWHKLLNTKLKFSVIRIPAEPKLAGVKAADKAAAKDEKAASTNPTEKTSAADLARQIAAAWKTGVAFDELTKKYDLKPTDSEEASLADLSRVFHAGTPSSAALKSIAALTTKSPFPENAFQDGDEWIALKLISNTTAPEKPTAEQLKATGNELDGDLLNSLQKAWVDSLRRTAKISLAQTPKP